MATTTNNGWETPDDTDLVKDGALAMRTLGNAIDTSAGKTWLAWTAYTPTWTNLTVGNATTTARYVRIGKTVHVYILFLFGSTTTVSGIFFPSMPVPTSQNGSAAAGWGFDNSATLWNNFTFSQSNYFVSASGSRYNATHPWTWATGDIIHMNITYEVV